MDATYDEDLSQNPFFAEFRNEHPELLEQCISSGWVLCVPRVGTVLSHIFTLQDFLGHILISNDDLPETHFITLTEKSLRVIGKVISVDQNNAGLPLEIHILFEETFYTVDHMKYNVWCIEYPIESEFQLKASNVSRCTSLATLRDCIDFIWTESSGKDVLENIDACILEFNNNFEKLQNITFNSLKDSVSSLYTKCLQKAFANRRLKERCCDCKNIMDNVKLAVETYMLHGVYKQVFGAVSSCSAYEDSNLNKIIRNLSDIQLRDLDIKQEFNQTIPSAKRMLSLIQSFSTIMGKVSCIRKTISSINNCSGDTNKKNHIYVTTDELLPIFIFLVIKCGLPNWYAHLNFIKHFRFSVHSQFQSDEVSFCVSTLEAVVEHIKSGIFTSCPCPEAQCPFDDGYVYENFEMIGNCNRKSDVVKSNSGDATDSLQFLFEQVRLSDYEKVKQILEQNKFTSVKDKNIENSANENDFEIRKTLSLEEVLNEDNFEKPLSLCHPLCTCSKCCRIFSNNLLRTSPTVFSCDGHGFTLLHIASIYGKPHIVDLALEMGANVNHTDYNGSTPLHYAASRGHQNALLLLLHAGAEINKQNMDRNTPLHLACNNGHECCVKAIVYFHENCKTDLKINLQNDTGDSPLHLASKWGYEGIARLLLEHGADPQLLNRKKKTAIDFAHSGHMAKLLVSNVPNLSGYVNVSLKHNVQPEFKCDQAKDDITLLDLRDSTESFYSNMQAKGTATKTVSKESIKPASTSGIRHIERLFRAIAYGDTKLACFYMNIDINNTKSNQVHTFKNNSSNNNLCHPLCTCQNCIKLKSTEIKLGDRFNINTCDSHGDTALHVAVRHGRLEISEALLTNGAIPDIQNKSGLTPLHIAAQENKVTSARLLLRFLNNPKLKDSVGNTPLHLASMAGSVDIVKMILEVDPCANMINFSGKTALDEAKDRMFLTIIALLEDSLSKSSTNTDW